MIALVRPASLIFTASRTGHPEGNEGQWRYGRASATRGRFRLNGLSRAGELPARRSYPAHAAVSKLLPGRSPAPRRFTANNMIADWTGGAPKARPSLTHAADQPAVHRHVISGDRVTTPSNIARRGCAIHTRRNVSDRAQCGCAAHCRSTPSGRPDASSRWRAQIKSSSAR